MSFHVAACGASSGDLGDTDAEPADAADATNMSDAGQADSDGAVDTVGMADADAAPSCEVDLPELATLRLQVDGSAFRDSIGRVVWLRGVNAGGRSKMPPFFPFAFAESGFEGQADDAPFDEAAGRYLDQAVEWGINVLRVPFSWEALEPERDRFDGVFAARYARFVELAGERGLRVIVDFHQDLWARPYCGDGAPLWTLPDPAAPIPAADDCRNWFLSYISDPDGVVFPAFDRFWANEGGVQDEFEAMWRHMASTTGEIDNVVAFEIFNEPHHGTADEEAWAVETLTPFFSRMAAAVREVVPGMPVFFESSGTDATDQSFFLELPEGESLVWAPHYYDPVVFLGGIIRPNFSAMTPIGTIAERARAWDVPVLLGEFGANAQNPSTPLYVRRTFDALDAHAMHGTLWQYSTAADDWNLEGFSITGHLGAETPVVDELVRVYPRATAGRPGTFVFDRESLTAQYDFDADAGGITEIVAPSRLYPGGPRVSIDGAACARWVESQGVLAVRAADAGHVTITLSAAAPSPDSSR